MGNRSVSIWLCSCFLPSAPLFCPCWGLLPLLLVVQLMHNICGHISFCADTCLLKASEGHVRHIYQAGKDNAFVSTWKDLRGPNDPILACFKSGKQVVTRPQPIKMPFPKTKPSRKVKASARMKEGFCKSLLYPIWAARKWLAGDFAAGNKTIIYYASCHFVTTTDSCTLWWECTSVYRHQTSAWENQPLELNLQCVCLEKEWGGVRYSHMEFQNDQQFSHPSKIRLGITFYKKKNWTITSSYYWTNNWNENWV